MRPSKKPWRAPAGDPGPGRGEAGREDGQELQVLGDVQGCHQKVCTTKIDQPIKIKICWSGSDTRKKTWCGSSKIAVGTLLRVAIKSKNGWCHYQCQFRIDIIRSRPSKKTWSGTSKIIVWTMPRVAIKSKKMSVVRVGGFRPLREIEMYPDPTQ